jgi:hypothetical protein
LYIFHSDIDEAGVLKLLPVFCGAVQGPPNLSGSRQGQKRPLSYRTVR